MTLTHSDESGFCVPVRCPTDCEMAHLLTYLLSPLALDPGTFPLFQLVTHMITADVDPIGWTGGILCLFCRPIDCNMKHPSTITADSLHSHVPSCSQKTTPLTLTTLYTKGKAPTQPLFRHQAMAGVVAAAQRTSLHHVASKWLQTVCPALPLDALVAELAVSYAVFCFCRVKNDRLQTTNQHQAQACDTVAACKPPSLPRKPVQVPL